MILYAFVPAKRIEPPKNPLFTGMAVALLMEVTVFSLALWCWS